MAPLKLLELPTDLLHLIASHITKPSDMVSLCLSHRVLHQVTVPHLYNKIVLSIGGENDLNLPAIFSQGNIGVKHIRDLHLMPDAAQCRKWQCDFALSLILEAVPPGNLQNLYWSNWTEFSGNNLIKLYKRQKQMTDLETLKLDEPFTNLIERGLELDWIPSKAEKLYLEFQSRAEIEMARELLRRVKSLKYLLIACCIPDDDEPSTLINDSIDAPGELTRTLFGHLMPFQNCEPLVIAELDLRDLSLSYCQETYCRAIDMSKLSELVVSDCHGANVLLADLCRSSKLPIRLKTLEFRHADDDETFEGLQAIQSFLPLISGLEKLYIDISRTKSLPSIECMMSHAKTVKILSLHASPADGHEHVYDLSAYKKIFTRFPALQQLSVATPPCSAARLGKSKGATPYLAFKQAIMDAENKLGELRTLQFTTWPVWSCYGRVSRKVYEHLLLLEATDFLGAYAETDVLRKLNVMAWGNEGGFNRSLTNDKAILFTRAEKRNLDIGKKPSATILPWNLRSYAEPHCSILTLEHKNGKGPPFQDVDESDDDSD